MTPLRIIIRSVADRVTTLIVGEPTSAGNLLRKDEFLSLVEEVAREGELNATERALIYNLLEAGDTEIVEIMTPRTRIQFLSADMTVPEMVSRFKEYCHPRVPVYRGHRDNLIGFVHSEDILRLVLDQVDLESLAPEDIMHPPIVVPITKKVDEMFEFFQDNAARAAICLNEFGGVDGFITMRDVINFIFGEISGKTEGEEYYRERDENVYIVPGDMKLSFFQDLTNLGIEDPRMTTIGGVAFRHLDRLPKVGDTVTVEGITITILDMDAHRIAKVRVSPSNADAEDDHEPAKNHLGVEEDVERATDQPDVPEAQTDLPSADQDQDDPAYTETSETHPESIDDDPDRPHQHSELKSSRKT